MLRPLHCSLLAVAFAAGCTGSQITGYDAEDDEGSFSVSVEESEDGGDVEIPPDLIPEPEPKTIDPGEPPPPPPPKGACFNGNKVCFDLYRGPMPSGGGVYHYRYPSSNDPRYKKPLAYIDRKNTPGDNPYVSANFRLEELIKRTAAQVPYIVIQPHAVAKLQAVRNRVGKSIAINSGYRSPGYNESVKGARISRHMYGDAFDMDVAGMSASALANVCRAEGASYVSTYANTNHTHCDWRNVALDPNFYSAMVAGIAAGNMGAAAYSALNWDSADQVQAELKQDDDGSWTAPATGFDEGEPTRAWSAYDADGDLLITATGERFVAPARTALVEVDVGSAISLEATVD